MELKSEKLRDLPLEDGKEAVMELLSGDDDVSVIVEKHGSVLRFAVMASYDQETKGLLAEAREEYLQRQKLGYSREEAFADLRAVGAELKQA